MQDSTKIEDVKFSYDGKKMVPYQTYITPFGEVYIAFKLGNGTYVNIRSSEVKEYIVEE